MRHRGVGRWSGQCGCHWPYERASYRGIQSEAVGGLDIFQLSLSLDWRSSCSTHPPNEFVKVALLRKEGRYGSHCYTGCADSRSCVVLCRERVCRRSEIWKTLSSTVPPRRRTGGTTRRRRRGVPAVRLLARPRRERVHGTLAAAAARGKPCQQPPLLGRLWRFRRRGHGGEEINRVRWKINDGIRVRSQPKYNWRPSRI